MRAPDEKRPRASATRLRYREMFEVVTRDPDFLVDMFLCAMADTGNPYYAWQALSVCLKHKKEIPDWLAAYLEQCIERMESDRARKAGDLREVLPWALDFSKRAGPGSKRRSNNPSEERPDIPVAPPE